MRSGDFVALTGIALGATTAAVLTVALVRAPPMDSTPVEFERTQVDLWVTVEPRESVELRGAFGFQPPIDFAVIRHPSGWMSGPESAANGRHRPSGPVPRVPGTR